MKVDEQILKDYWAQFGDENFTIQKINKTEIMEAITVESKLTLVTLKKRLLAKIRWVVFFILAFGIASLFSLDNIEMVGVLCLFNAIYILSFFYLWNQYKKLRIEQDLSANTLDVLRYNYTCLKRVLNMERIFGVMTFPLAIIVGALISRLQKGFTLAESLNDQRLLLFLIGGILILVPLMYLMSEKMNKIAFGELKSNLEKNITRLEMFNS